MNFSKGIQPPKSRMVTWRSSFKNPKSSHCRIIETHYFNSKLELFFPFTSQTKNAANQLAQQLLQSTSNNYFYAVDCPPHILVDQLRLLLQQNYKVYAISVGTRLESGNAIVILPTGTMILQVDKDTYEQLGLQGKKSKFKVDMLHSTRFRITVDLAAKSFVPNRKLYERVMWALKKLENAHVLLSVYNEKGECVEPNKLLENAKFSKVQGYGDSRHFKFKNIKIPVEIQEDESSMKKMINFLGSVSCGIPQLYEHQDISFMLMDLEKSKTYEGAYLIRFEGFIPPKKVQSDLDLLRKYVCENEKEIDWVSVLVTGFEDSCVSWGTMEHGYEISGENDYAFIMFSDERYWLYQMLGQKDVYS